MISRSISRQHALEDCISPTGGHMFILAVIAFGSAVRHPGVQEVSRERRKYLLFGEKVTKVKQVAIQPSDADFLVITGENLMREEVIEPISLHTYDCGSWIEKGGIRLVNLGVGPPL